MTTLQHALNNLSIDNLVPLEAVAEANEMTVQALLESDTAAIIDQFTEGGCVDDAVTAQDAFYALGQLQALSAAYDLSWVQVYEAWAPEQPDPKATLDDAIKCFANANFDAGEATWDEDYAPYHAECLRAEKQLRSVIAQQQSLPGAGPKLAFSGEATTSFRQFLDEKQYFVMDLYRKGAPIGSARIINTHVDDRGIWAVRMERVNEHGVPQGVEFSIPLDDDEIVMEII